MDGESSLVSHGDTGTYTLASWYTPHLDSGAAVRGGTRGPLRPPLGREAAAAAAAAAQSAPNGGADLRLRRRKSAPAPARGENGAFLLAPNTRFAWVSRPTAGPVRRPARPSARRLRCPPRAPGARKRGAASSRRRVFLEITPHSGCPFLWGYAQGFSRYGQATDTRRSLP